MKTFLTPLQGYNAMYRLLDDYYNKTKDDDILSLLPVMVFLPDNGTFDPAIWSDWIDAIDDKKRLTKQEAFDGMIRFFEEYHAIGPYDYTKLIIDELRSAKNCDDVSVLLVKQWGFYVNEVLCEQEGTREYIQFRQKKPKS